MEKSTILKIVGLVVLFGLLIGVGCTVSGWFNGPSSGEARKNTDAIMDEVKKMMDDRLPQVVPERADEAEKKGVKDRAEVHEEAKTLSEDVLADALNSELVRFDAGVRIRADQ